LALITCPHCGKSSVSSYAAECPACRHPIARGQSRESIPGIDPTRSNQDRSSLVPATSSAGNVSPVKVKEPPGPVEVPPIGLRSVDEKREIRRRAEAWSSGYFARAVDTLVASARPPSPGLATKQLNVLKAEMCLEIGRFYSKDISQAEAANAASAIGLAPLAGKIAVLEAALAAGPAGEAILPTIARGIVRVLAHVVINHFENLDPRTTG
jgi:hypothetical protein